MSNARADGYRRLARAEQDKAKAALVGGAHISFYRQWAAAVCVPTT